MASPGGEDHSEEAWLSQVFSVGSESFTWEDVVLCAQLRGAWPDLQHRCMQGLACLRQLEDLETDLAQQDVEAAGDRFRYERGLLTADEIEGWLVRRRLTVEDWIGFLRRSLLLERWSVEVETTHLDFPTEQAHVDEILWAEGICSGILPAMAEELAGRAAVWQALLEGYPPPVTREETPEQRVVTIERAFERFVERTTTPAALQAAVESHELEWVRLRCRSATFATEDAAREAAAWVRHDGRDLVEVATASSTEAVDTELFLDEYESDLRTILLGAQPGDLVGPIQLEDKFWTVAVLGRVHPAIEDPAVAARAKRAIITSAAEREIRDRVRWDERF